MSLTSVHVYWYAIPLVLAMSLVYSASRHERWRTIVVQALRLAGMILGVLVATMAILLVINSQV